MDDAKLHELIRLMLRLLMAYEAEMTAYHSVLEHVDRGMLSEGRDLHIHEGLDKLANSMGLAIEVEAVYAGFHAIQQEINPASVDAALTTIRRIVEDRKSRFMPS